MRRILRRSLLGVMVVFFVPVLYFAASFVGAVIPAGLPSEQMVDATSSAKEPQVELYILSGFLHADLMLPVDEALKIRFDFLRGSSVPIENPNMKYLSVGWGSRAFYTTAGSYSDIELAAVIKAVTGDSAVMRFVGLGDVSSAPDAVRITLTTSQYERLLKQIEDTLSRQQGSPVSLPHASIGSNDAFFEAKGHFNIMHPCNQWLNEVLRASGKPIGAWTPTSQSFLWSLSLYQ